MIKEIVRNKKLAHETGVEYIEPDLAVDSQEYYVPLLIDEKQTILNLFGNPLSVYTRFDLNSYDMGPNAARYFYKVRVFAKARMLYPNRNPSELYDDLFGV